MTAAIFMVNGDQLVEMSETAYDSEAVLQELLASHPRLLAGDSTAGGPQRWMLVKREAALAHESGLSTWSVDHVFLDQHGIPTIVEVKRSSNTEIRRSVVGQMLDYAANAIVYWPAESIKAMFEASCERDEVDPEARLSFSEQTRTEMTSGRRCRPIFRPSGSVWCSSLTRSRPSCDASSSS